MTKITCPHCGQVGKLPENYAGQKVRCGTCNKVVPLESLGGAPPPVNVLPPPIVVSPPSVRISQETTGEKGSLVDRARERGDFDQVISMCSRRLEEQPTHIDSIVNLAFALHKQGRLYDALFRYRQLQEIEPGNPTWVQWTNCVQQQALEMQSTRHLKRKVAKHFTHLTYEHKHMGYQQKYPEFARRKVLARPQGWIYITNNEIILTEISDLRIKLTGPWILISRRIHEWTSSVEGTRFDVQQIDSIKCQVGWKPDHLWFNLCDGESIGVLLGLGTSVDGECIGRVLSVLEAHHNATLERSGEDRWVVRKLNSGNVTI